MVKTAFVTGGSGDIGSVICKRLCLDGYSVAIGYFSNKEAAENLCSSLSADGYTATAIQIDLSDPDSVREAYEQVCKAIGSPDVLINNAGAAHIGLLSDMSDEEIIKLINTDLTGSILLSKRAAADMVKNHSGRIVSISSVWGEVGASCEAVYSAAKAGIIGFTKALGKELAPSGITVNCIAAGMIDTKMNSLISDEGKASIVESIPADRMGTPEEIASAVSFLCSEGAGYITAQCLRVDGGWI